MASATTIGLRPTPSSNDAVTADEAGEQRREHRTRIQNAAVTTIKIAEGAITTGKIANGAVTLNKLGADVHQRFKRIDATLDKANGGVAMAMAMANIPTVSIDTTFSLGVGMGTFEGANSLAVGASLRISENLVTQMSVGMTDEDNAMGAALGASLQW